MVIRPARLEVGHYDRAPSRITIRAPSRGGRNRSPSRGATFSRRQNRPPSRGATDRLLAARNMPSSRDGKEKTALSQATRPPSRGATRPPCRGAQAAFRATCKEKSRNKAGPTYNRGEANSRRRVGNQTINRVHRIQQISIAVLPVQFTGTRQHEYRLPPVPDDWYEFSVQCKKFHEDFHVPVISNSIFDA